jgi:hypothetical protein
MALAPNRRQIYGISYPRNHFFIFDLNTRKVRDIGRIGNINPQCIFIDSDENAYTTDDYGKLLKYTADKDELAETGVILPHATFRNGYHNTVYDVVPTLDGSGVFGVTWTWGQRLFHYDFKANHLTDYGRAYGEETQDWSHIINDHAGGLVFGADGKLYFVINRKNEHGGSSPYMVSMNPENGRREMVGMLQVDGIPGDHIARGAMDAEGNLYFAEAGNTPTKLFKCRPDYSETQAIIKTRRLWG